MLWKIINLWFINYFLFKHVHITRILPILYSILPFTKSTCFEFILLCPYAHQYLRIFGYCDKFWTNHKKIKKKLLCWNLCIVWWENVNALKQNIVHATWKWWIMQILTVSPRDGHILKFTLWRSRECDFFAAENCNKLSPFTQLQNWIMYVFNISY